MKAERPPDQGCPLPPPGWYCSRKPGHQGPCAARRRPAPRADDTNPPESHVTRLEVIDHRSGGAGRAFSAHDCRIELSYQDQGATLKVFVTNPPELSMAEPARPSRRERFAEFEQRLRELDAILLATNPRLRHGVFVRHEDGSTFVFANAFLVHNAEDDLVAVMTEHTSIQIFYRDDLEIYYEFDTVRDPALLEEVEREVNAQWAERGEVVEGWMWERKLYLPRPETGA